MDTLERVAEARHRFTVEEYLALSRAGVLPERTELIEGDIYDMMTHSPRHRAMVKVMTDNFTETLRRKATVFAQSALAFEGWSPKPDVMMLEYRPDLYENRQPTTEETLLIVEVSDTTLFKDRAIKLRNYAAQEISEYWLVNLVEDVLECYRYPRGQEYADKTTLPLDARIAPLAFPDDAHVWTEVRE